MAMTPASEGPLVEGARAGQLSHVLFVTNRYNLLQILSSGLVAPRAAYPKYYTDLLEGAPGRVPLIRWPVSSDVAELVSGGDETAFPVALELDLAGVGALEAPALEGTAFGSTARALADPSAVAWAPNRVFALSSVRRVLFRSETELEEHRARSYDNVPDQEIHQEVAPQCFAGESTFADTLLRWLSELPPCGPDAKAFHDADRLSGARCLALAALPSAPRAADAVLRLFDGRTSGTPSKGARTQTVAPWIMAASITGANGKATVDLNGRLFRAAAEVLLNSDRSSSWRPLDALAEIERITRARKLGKKESEELSKNLERIRAILRNESDLRPFRPGVGLDVAKALLLVLLRPEPQSFAAWAPAETGADDPVQITAAVLCGLLNGRQRIPAVLRPGTLDRLLARFAAAELNSVGLAEPSKSREVTSTLTLWSDESTGRAAVLAGDEPLVEWELPPRSVFELLEELDLGRPSAMQTAMAACRLLGWGGCFRTEIASDSQEITVSRRGRGVTAVVSGWPTITERLDATAFKAKLGESEAPAELEQELRLLIQGAGGSPPVAGQK